MPKNILPRSLVLGSAILLATTGATGCVALTNPAAHSNCAWSRAASTGSTSGSGTAGASSNTVVLIDTSASFWPRKGSSESLPDNPGNAVSELLQNFGNAGTRLVSLGTFNGSSTTVTWQLADASLPTPTGTAALIRKERQAAGQCLTPLVTQAVQGAPPVPGTDVMSALDAAGLKLGSSPPGHSRVVLFTDGQSNAGCLNLNKVFRVGEDPADVVRSCVGQGGLARLRGMNLQLKGVGFQALGKPLTTGEQSWLVNYWRDLCTALKVAAPQSCVTSEGSSSPRTSDTARLADPPIAFPRVHGPRIVVPAPLLFAFNSSTLTPTALSLLNILVQKIRSSGRSVTQIIGHTDRVGTAAYNLGLSQRRAQAVRSYLAQQGFTGISARGVGFSQPACRAEYTSSGRPNEACMAKDRSVDIILGGRQ